jgi:hypothetical protein
MLLGVVEQGYYSDGQRCMSGLQQLLLFPLHSTLASMCTCCCTGGCCPAWRPPASLCVEAAEGAQASGQEESSYTGAALMRVM